MQCGISCVTGACDYFKVFQTKLQCIINQSNHELLVLLLDYNYYAYVFRCNIETGNIRNFEKHDIIIYKKLNNAEFQMIYYEIYAVTQQEYQ